MRLRTLLLSMIGLTISGFAQADSMCGDGGYYNAQLGICQGGGAGGVWAGGSRDNNTQQHTPRDYYGAIAADVVTGQASYSSNNYTSAAAAKSASVQKCGLPGCKVIIAYKNGCGATATSSIQHVVGGIGDSPEEAEKNALAKCEQTKSGGTCDIWATAECSYYQ